MKSKFKFPVTRLGLPLFVIGLGTVIFLKVLENKSVDTLVDKNTALLAEWETKNRFQQLESDITGVDATLHSVISTGDTGNSEAQAAISKQMEKVRSEMETIRYMQENQDSFNGSASFEQLAKLFTEKSELLTKCMTAFSRGNAEEAKKLFNSPSHKELDKNIAAISSTLFQTQNLSTAEIAESIRKDGENANTRSAVFAIGSIIGCGVLCMYFIMKKKQDQASEKKVKAAASVKENFLANMSHEIRTPLNAILGFTNILQKTRLDSQQLKHIQIIQTSGNNLLSIVNDILDLSKIEAGMMRIEESPFRVADVMATVEQMLSPKAEEKNLQLIIKVDEEIPETVCGDAVRLTQVLINLVSNSIKFTEEGGVYVRVTPFKKTGESISLEILVRDTGIGIPKDKQKYIFERFEQAEAETTRRFGGTGLGLAIVKHLIELQKGTITLNSEEGSGTSVLVELPYKMTNETIPVVKQDKNLQNLRLMNNNTCKILVAEDNIMNQHLIKHLLKTWDFEFDLVFNGMQAIESLKKQNYDLVLMDIQMPEMDGHTATKIIRSELKSNVPVIAMTAHAMAGEREKCITNGMNDYISKPINEESLYNLIIKYAAAGGKQTTTTEKAKVIDLKYIESFSDGNQELKNEMIREFVKTVPSNLHTLEKAIQEKNYGTINRIAHDLKTTVHFLGLTALIGHLLQKIEELASSSGTMIAITQMFGDVKSVCMQAVQEAGHLVAAVA